MTSLTDSLHLSIDIERLARTYGARLKRFVGRRIGNASDIEDIVQETLLEAFACASRFRGESSPETWLCAIAMNRIRIHYRTRKRHARYHCEATVDAEGSEDTLARFGPESHDPQGYYEARQALRQIEKRMSGLSDTLSVPLRLLIDDELSYQEIADRLHVPVGTVRSRISRARDGVSEPGVGR